MKKYLIFSFLFGLGLALTACSDVKEKTHQEKKVTEESTSNSTKETFSLKNLVEEKKQIPNDVINKLNAQHHQLKVLERRTVPGPFVPPKMKNFADYAVTLDQLPVINPGPGEYVHVMEGQ